jgi:phosphoribosyl-ATP pyrophosphohydrolase/phosphoribosyl-AMP cyclohydrolase
MDVDIESKVVFDKKGLVPAIIQDAHNGEVLMLAYMNRESLRRTIESGQTWFWSRSRQEFWCKGETSGHKQYVKEIRYDCDGDALLVLVDQIGVACHTGERSCFYRNLDGSVPQKTSAPEAKQETILKELYRLIKTRQEEMPLDSYTAQLLKEGQEKILAKVEEETDEVIEAVRQKERFEIVSEVSDLVFHLLILLASLGLSLDDIETELARRRK